jgi:outer membrane receptor protein involved in Fe transport
MEYCHPRLPLAVVIVITLAAANALVAQPSGPQNAGQSAGSITGQVFDADLKVPIEYANVVLRSLHDSSQVDGTVTDKSGRFTLAGVRPGRYFVEVSFIGYRQKSVSDIAVGPGAIRDLGRLTLRQAAVEVPGVEATAERPSLEYRIDKKVVDVSKMATVASGTAVDVLENVPSVKVDAEGNLTLRGSSNYTVLIDGKPSPVEGSDALQQIPAGTIDKIEIITNPSAKYDPEGVSGIVNVLLKKQKQAGISGMATLDGGWPQRYGGSFLLNYRLDGLSLFAGADLRDGKSPGTRETRSWTRDTTGDTTFSNSIGEGERGHGSYGLRAGGDYRFSESDQTSLRLQFSGMGFGMNQSATYSRWTTSETDTARQLSQDSSSRGGTHLSVNIEHQHKFGPNGHQLLASANYMRRAGDDWSVNRLSTLDSVLISGLRQKETGPRQPVQLKLDYTLPLRQEDKLEAGVQASIHRARSVDSTWAMLPDGRPDSLLYGQSVDYSDNILALYAQYPAKLGKFGLQPGFRVEHTDRSVAGDTGSPIPLERWDYFPSLHISYELPARQQVMASYTRRIERPRGWELWPFLSHRDAYNVQVGNPHLRPELTDAIEAGWQMPLGASRVSAEAYYRITHDRIDHVRSVYAPGVILFTTDNVGTDYSLGTEFLFDLQLLKWWNIDLSGDLYDYRLVTTAGTSDRSFSWNGRLSNEFRLPTQTRLQFDLHFESPEISVQGRDEGHFISSAAIRQQFFDRQLSVTLQVRDLFGSGKFESTAEGPDFYNHFRFERAAPMFSLNLTWNFNNYRPDRRQREEGVEEMENGGEFEQ